MSALITSITLQASASTVRISAFTAPVAQMQACVRLVPMAQLKMTAPVLLTSTTTTEAARIVTISTRTALSALTKACALLVQMRLPTR